MDTLFQQLDAIHTTVLNHFTYKTDMDQYGVDEKWVMPSPTYRGATAIVGDCEDFALACRKLCRDSGLQTRLVVCSLRGEGHCVLECQGWIMCCNQKHVMSRDVLQTQDYVWFYMSGYNANDAWHEIKA